MISNMVVNAKLQTVHNDTCSEKCLSAFCKQDYSSFGSSYSVERELNNYITHTLIDTDVS